MYQELCRTESRTNAGFSEMRIAEIAMRHRIFL
jgi:hypothetical protein